MTTLPPLNFGPGLAVAHVSINSPLGEKDRENQDNYLLIDAHGQAECLKGLQRQRMMIAGWPPGHLRLAVLDGLGGHGQGREIAERIVEELARLPALQDQTTLTVALDALHARIRAEFTRERKPPGATLLMLEIPREGEAMLYHVGDSRLYAISAEGVQCLTVDHAPPTAFYLQGLLDHEEWYRQVHEQDRSAISQAFGMGSAMKQPGHALSADLTPLAEASLPPELAGLADRRSLALSPTRFYLLATDGFWSYPAPQDFIQRWPSILFKDRPTGIDSRLMDLVEAHIFASAGLNEVDNSTAILFKRGHGTAPERLEKLSEARPPGR